METKQIFIVWKNYVYVVKVPITMSSYYCHQYAREKLNVPKEDITPWGECNFVENVAKFDYNFKQ